MYLVNYRIYKFWKKLVKGKMLVFIVIIYILIYIVGSCFFNIKKDLGLVFDFIIEKSKCIGLL